MINTKSKKAKAATKIDDPSDSHINKLVGLSVLTKFALIIITIFGFRSFIDQFAIDYYYQHAVTLFNGSLPYLNYSYEYPILSWFPVLVAYIPAYLLNSEAIFFFAFMGLMIIADIVTVICVYKIALVVCGGNKKALFAGVLYATAFQAIPMDNE